MTELCKHIGADTDVPAGDIGVTGLEVGFLFGQYKKIRNEWAGVLTGKGGTWGGSLIRPEATGYGVVYYVNHMIKYVSEGNESFAGKRVVISGSGNVAQYAAIKVIELGGIVVSLSDSKGSLVATGSNSFTTDDVSIIAKVKGDRKQISEVVSSFSGKFKYIANARPWIHVGKVDVALPCATQNEVSGEEAQALIDAGAKFIAEGSNMGCTQAAVDVFEAHRQAHAGKAAIWYGPGKAANSGGVAVSGLEMAQNSARLTWTGEEVDNKLKAIMESTFRDGISTANKYSTPESGKLPSLVAGSNIAGFLKVADAMHNHGDWW